MAVKVLLFAQAAEWAGRRELARPVRRPLRLAELLAWPELARLAGRLSGTRCAINQEFAGEEAWVKDGDEVAVLPPVSGG